MARTGCRAQKRTHPSIANRRRIKSTNQKGFELMIHAALVGGYEVRALIDEHTALLHLHKYLFVKFNGKHPL